MATEASFNTNEMSKKPRRQSSQNPDTSLAPNYTLFVSCQVVKYVINRIYLKPAGRLIKKPAQLYEIQRVREKKLNLVVEVREIQLLC